MISPELENQIFLALPSTFTVNDITIPVYKERSAIAKVSEYLSKHPESLYMVIDYSGDEIFRQETSMNYWFDEIPIGDKVQVVKGTRNQITLDIHLYMVYTVIPMYRIGIMEQILNQMQHWVIFELEKLVDYPKFGSIQAIDQTEDRLLHRIVSCSFVYTDIVTTMVDTIKVVDYDLITEPSPAVKIEESVVIDSSNNHNP